MIKVLKITILAAISMFVFSCREQYKIENLQINPSSLTMTVGQTAVIDAWIEPIDAAIHYKIYFRTSQYNVAQVTSTTGVVTAVGTGTCEIIAFADNNKVIKKCKVTVTPAAYNLPFSKAVAYYDGEADGLKYFDIRLLSDGYQVEQDGNISGLGYYCRLYMLSQNAVNEPNTGTYTPSSQPQNLTYIIGQMSPDSTQISGSFLAQPLSSYPYITIEKGNLQLGKTSGEYTFSADFISHRKDTIQVAYRGSLQIIDRTIIPDTLHFNSQNATIENLGNIYGFAQNIFRVKFEAQNADILQIEFIVPLSAGVLPAGHYSLNGTNGVFSLVPSNTAAATGTILTENNLKIGFLYGYADVQIIGGQYQYSFYLVDENHRVVD